MHPHRAILVAALVLLPLALAGCTTEDGTRAPPEVVQAVANTEPMTWERGNYWSYAATFENGRTYHIALVVHEQRDDGFRLGSNLSSGFFGLPFSGNVTSELNPEIGGSVWPMFDFPLSDGKTWEYALWGYDAKTTAYAALVDVPGHGRVPGFRLESSSFGQVFARYDYAPLVGWFTRLTLIEPSDRTQVLDVRIEDFGAAFGQGYYVERVIKSVRATYPAELPGMVEVRVPHGFLQVHVTLSAEATAGVAEARLEDGKTRVVAEARAAAKGLDSDRVTIEGGGHVWTLRHAGSGVSSVYLEVTGVRAMGGGTGLEGYRETGEQVDLAGALAAVSAAA